MLTQTEALIRCQNQFRSYERQHRAKCTPEGYAKAEVNADMARLCEAALSIEVTYSSGYLGVVEPRRDVRKALDNAILYPNPLVGAAACIIQEIEEVPGWADNASLITIRAHAWVLLQDLPDALSLPDPKPEGVPAWRPEVRAFADLMEAQLKANDHKPGWKGDDPNALWSRLSDEALELTEEVGDSARDPILVGKEAADVANFAMMIADVCGALSTPTKPPSEDALKAAAESLIAQKSDYFTARNGKKVSIEGDDGEKCWIVPFDAMNELEIALSTPTDQQPKAEGPEHRFGAPPEPVVNPSEAWCDAYAAWYNQEPTS